MGRIAIAAYRPKPGQQAALEALVRLHHEQLRAEGLVTDRPPIAMRAADGTIVEVFEWQSKEAIAAAHDNPQVIRMWERFAETCDYVPMSSVHEATELFAEFEALKAEEPLRPELSP